MGVTLHTYTHGELNWDQKVVPLSGGSGDSDLERVAAAINVAAVLSSGTDLNTVVVAGMYSGATLSNAPLGSANTFLVHVVANVGGSVVQTANQLSSGDQFRRTFTASAWSAWRKIADDSSIQGIIGDTGWVTSSTGITAATGWTVSGSKYRIRNGLAMVGVSGAKNATAVAAGTAGAIANSPFATLPALLVPSSTNGLVLNNGSASGFMATGYVSQATSQLVFTGAPAGIPASGVLDAYAEYYL